MNFVALRADGHAQWEIQQYGEAMAHAMRDIMPWTYEAFLLHGWKGENPKITAERSALAGVETTVK
jgi:thymidylate synthase ThyX